MLHEAASLTTDPDHPWGCLMLSSTVNRTSPEVEKALRTIRDGAGREKLEQVAATAMRARPVPPPPR